ncbi:UNC93-like protein 2 [Zancudomyces culisetae]|uniref:UNC93-like protein 2 n=1 Tax=Zancudomyces culisetae TaxID=1213189 RepID=A0A1R1PX99_ZANCU|nr:UNC93-like protein 2 [Zancudomyces culisetae]|eukprot:OMH85610.1 UNC93-like protein 2 [Zancudomyces culisetae]
MMVFKNILTNAFYSTTKAQVVLLGIICFCVAGMFNALNSMGGGGQKSVSVGANANFALGLAFGIFGFFSSAVVNRLGVRIPLFVSCIVCNNNCDGGYTWGFCSNIMDSPGYVDNILSCGK